MLSESGALETTSIRQPTVTASASGGSGRPHHVASAVQLTYQPSETPPQIQSSVADLRARFLIDARSAFSCFRRAAAVASTSRDHARQPEVVEPRDVTAPTKPRIWSIADLATMPDSHPPRPNATVSDKTLSVSVL